VSLPQILFSFDGRLRRTSWWLYSILLGLLFVGIAYLLGSIFTFLLAPGLGILVFILLYLLFLYSAVALGVKRLHDRGKSGRWMWLYVGVPFALTFIILYASWSVIAGAGSSFFEGLALAITDPTRLSQALDSASGRRWSFLILICQLGTGLIGLWALVDLGFLGGTPGYNAYGPDPRITRF
jgi:uncharacterized membrane protein YhaH (DUF805 family)